MASQPQTTVFRRPGRSGATSGQAFLPPECSECLGHRQSRNLRNRLTAGDVNGLVAWLPDKSKVPGSSCVFLDKNLNDGAFRHPCLIINTSPCTHLVFCLQITSFGKRTIWEKYKNCSNLKDNRAFNDYVAFKEPGTVPHNTHGLLEYTGPPLDDQSYAHLEFAFWIERQYLVERDSRILQPRSFSMIVGLYQDAETRRRLFGQPSIEKLANPVQQRTQSASPLLSDVPIVSCRRNGQTVASQPSRVSSLGKRDFENFDTSSQQSTSGRTNSSFQTPSAYPQKWRRRNDQNCPPPEAKRLAMARDWRVRQPVA